MLSIRKKIAVSASLLMATAGIVASVQTAAPATSSSPASARQKAAVTVSIVPGIIGPGGGLQSSKKAKWAVIGKYGTGKVGKKVVLQRQSGSKWVTADKSVVDKKGTVIFAVPSPGSTAVTYRVDGPGSASAPVSTDSWGTDADFVDEFGGSKLDLADWSHRQSFYEPASKRECSKGDPKAVKVVRRHGQAERAGRQEAQRAVQAEEARQERDLRQVQVPPERQHRHPVQAHHHLRRGVRPHQVPAAPGPARLAVDAAEKLETAPTDAKAAGTEIDIIEWFGKDVPNGGLTSFIYAPSYQGKKIPLGGAGAAGSRSPSSTSRTRRTTGTSATTCSPWSGTRRATSSASTARRRDGSTRESPACPSTRS